MPEAQTPSRYSAMTGPRDHMEKALSAPSTLMPARSPMSRRSDRLRRTAASSTTKAGEGTRLRSKRAKAAGSPALVSMGIPFDAVFLRRQEPSSDGGTGLLPSQEHVAFKSPAALRVDRKSTRLNSRH